MKDICRRKILIPDSPLTMKKYNLLQYDYNNTQTTQQSKENQKVNTTKSSL
jgi:hypothetical protein